MQLPQKGSLNLSQPLKLLSTPCGLGKGCWSGIVVLGVKNFSALPTKMLVYSGPQHQKGWEPRIYGNSCIIKVVRITSDYVVNEVKQFI